MTGFAQWARARRVPGRGVGILAVLLVLAGCEAAPEAAPRIAAQGRVSSGAFARLVERVSEPGGFFDTDNLISNETGYLKVVDAIRAAGVQGGAYVGVGPDQNYSYIAAIRPEIAFIVDIRRDNLLHHLLLKALVERSPGRVEFLSALHGARPPSDADAWHDRDLAEIVAWVDDAPREPAYVDEVTRAVLDAVDGYGIPLGADDRATVERFHRTFIDRGLDLRFTSYGRTPRPYYPTYRQLVLETDVDGDPASYLATPEGYEIVRALHGAHRIVPVVGDLAGDHALRELGRVLREMETPVTALYVSNVEFYLWQSARLDDWLDNLRALPTHPDALLIRSYFPNGGRLHPSAVPGYYSAQSVHPVSSVRSGEFGSYWDLVTRDALELAVGAGR